MIEIGALRALPALRDYDDRELAALLGSSSERAYAPGEVLFHEGARERSCLLVVSGEVELVRATPSGERRMGSLGPGTFLGQLSLVDGGARASTARALAPVKALEFTRDVFEALLRARSPLALRFQRQVAIAGIRKLRGATAQLLEVLAAEPKAPAAPAPSADGTRDVLRYIQTSVDEWGAPLENATAQPQERPQTRPYPSRPPR